VLSEIIAKIKERYEKEFNLFNECFGYERILGEFDIKEVQLNLFKLKIIKILK
jgi:hypothetical protein